MAGLVAHYANFRVPALLREPATRDDDTTTLLDQAEDREILKAAQDEAAPRKAAEPVTAAERLTILSLYAAGNSAAEVARQVGRSLDTVIRLLKAADVAIRQQTRPFEPNPLAERNQAIVDAHRSGVRTVDLAARYGLDPSGIRRIVRQHKDPQ